MSLVLNRAHHRVTEITSVLLSTACLLVATVAAAGQPATPPATAGTPGGQSAPGAGRAADAGRERNTVEIANGVDGFVVLDVGPTDDGSIRLAIASQAPRCRFAESVFELPIQLDRTGFQLKHAIRPVQNREGDGTCSEAVVTVYRPEHYWPLKNAAAVILHLPWGPVPLNDEALGHIKAITPTRPADDLGLKADEYLTLINRIGQLLQAGQAARAREAVEVLLPAFATRPADESFAFFNTLGMARRLTGDLAFAASSYDVAIMLAQMTAGTPNIGSVYDNLATVRRLQKRYDDAEKASTLAIASLEPVDHPTAREVLGGALNNRAILLAEQERYDEALPFSERALALLRVAWKDRPKQLEPFLDDNRKIRNHLPVR